MHLDSDPAWSRWVGRTLILPDGTTAVVRMARREYSTDMLWAVDTRGTMHQIRRRFVPKAPCIHVALQKASAQLALPGQAAAVTPST